MGELLYTVRDALKLKGPGLVVVAEAPSDGASLSVGDAIELRRPGCSPIVTEVAAFPLINLHDSARWVPISFPHEVGEEDVPAGTEIWSHP